MLPRMQERLVVDSDDVLVVAPALAEELAAVAPAEPNEERMLEALGNVNDPLMAMIGAMSALNDLAPVGWFFGPHPEQHTAFGWWSLDTAAQYVSNAVKEEMHALQVGKLAGFKMFQEEKRRKQAEKGPKKRGTREKRPARPIEGVPYERTEAYAPTLEEKLAEAQLALSIVSELQERGALFIHNNSGGKDSQAMLIYMVEVVGIPVEQIASVHADLGELEWKATEEKARSLAEHYGVEFFVVERAKGVKMTERFTQRAMTHVLKGRFTEEGELTASPFPSKGERYCTSEYKTAPCRQMAEQIAIDRGLGKDVVHCLGLRAEESSDRGFRPALDSVTHMTKSGIDVWDWLPIQLLLEDDVFKMIAAANQEPHWIYGEGMERASCSFCIYSSPDDLVLAAKLRPDLYSVYVALEQHYGKRYSMKNEYLEDITGIQADEKIISEVRSKLVPLSELIERYGGIGRKAQGQKAWTESKLREFRHLGFAGAEESELAQQYREESLAEGRYGPEKGKPAPDKREGQLVAPGALVRPKRKRRAAN